MTSISTFDHEPHWIMIKELAENHSLAELKSFINTYDDPFERNQLFRFAIQTLNFRDWYGKNLNLLIELGDMAISDGMKSSLSLSQEEDRNLFKDQVNILCYNMSANLADCWNDKFNRGNIHFEKGLVYAEKALMLRAELRKGPMPFSMAFWAKGVHHFFLNQKQKAMESFELSLDHAEKFSREVGKTTDLNAEADFSLILAHGYIALVEFQMGKPTAYNHFENSIHAFNEMKLLSEEAKQDAMVGLDQLLYVKHKYVDPNLRY